MIDLFGQYHQNAHIRYLREESGRFIVRGLHKQIFDILMLRKGIRSRVVIDPSRERIYFPDADVELEKVHRREKALYALLLLESQSGGVNLNKPAGAKLQQRHAQRMQRIQEKICHHLSPLRRGCQQGPFPFEFGVALADDESPPAPTH